MQSAVGYNWLGALFFGLQNMNTSYFRELGDTNKNVRGACQGNAWLAIEAA